MRKGSLSHRQTAKAQASLHIRAASPENSLFAHTIKGLRGSFRQRAHILDPFVWLGMRIWRISNHTTIRSLFSWDGSFGIYKTYLLFPACPTECPEGQLCLRTGFAPPSCVCPPGMNKDKDGNCVPCPGKMSPNTTKTIRGHMYPAKIKLSLGICAQSDHNRRCPLE